MPIPARVIYWSAAAAILAVVVVVTSVAISRSGEGSGSGKPVAGNGTTKSRTSKSAAGSAALPVDRGRRAFKPPTDSEWKKLTSNLTPAQAKLLLERDRLQEKNLDVRAERAWLIISQLCQNGYPHEAWELIEQSPGDVREKGLGGFFRDANLPKAELLAMMDALQPKERATSLFGYWSRFSPEEFVKMDLAEFPLRSPMETSAFRSTLEEMIAQAYDPKSPQLSQQVRQDLLLLAAERANAGMLKYEDFKTLLGKDPSKDGFTYWEILKAVDPQLRAGQTSGKANYDGPDAMVIRAMAVQDPEKTMDMTMVPDSHESNYIHIAMGEWLRKDFNRANEWVESHQASFTPDQMDRTAVAFVRAQVSRGEYDSAAQWMEHIQDPRWAGAVWWERKQIEEQSAAK
jgi:hypothetical protein